MFISLLVWLLRVFGLKPCKVGEGEAGTTRIVILLKSVNFVIKIPVFIPKHYWKHLQFEFSNSLSDSKSFGDFITKILSLRDCQHHVYMLESYVIGGVTANIREFIFWRKHCCETFLVPTYFSFFGLFNIMPLGEVIPTTPDLFGLWKKLTANQCFEDHHHFVNNRNFVIYQGKLCTCDYGSTLTQSIILNHFKSLSGLAPFEDLGLFKNEDVD